MRYFLSICGIIMSYLMIRYRERAADMIGEAEWMNKIGGVYNLMIICGVLLFFWSFAELTNTTDFLFGPLLNSIPFFHPQAPAPVPLP
jgi:hypothetical protein